MQSAPIVAVAKRYYKLAVADDGRRACGLRLAVLAKEAAPTFGSPPGPAFLRGVKTCSGIMARLFKHDRRLWAIPMAVTEVVVNGDHAFALLGSTRMRASYLILQRERGEWKIAAVVATEMF